MPQLVRLYIVNVLIGFAIALAFVAALVWFDVAGLRHLVLETDTGWLGGLMLVMFNGVVFAGVQFAIAVMKLAEPPEGPKGGTRAPAVFRKLVPVRIKAQPAPRRRR